MKKRAALIGAAVLPAVAMLSSSAQAAPTLVFTNQGTTNGSGQTATGYTSFLISVQADAGQVITAVDLGQTAAATNGIFGSLLQNWVPGKAVTPTPVDPSTNGGVYGIDSHILVGASARVDATAPFENSNLVNPGGGVPPDDASQRFGTGTYLHGVFGIQGGSSQVNLLPLAYVSIPNGSGSVSVDVSEAVPGFPGVGFHLTGTFSTGGGPVTNKIVSLTAVSGGAPTTYGNKLTNGAGVDKATFNPNAPVADSINVTGSSGSYIKGEANAINNGAGQSKFYVQASGFSPATDQEIYALNLTSGGTDTTPAQETTIANEINASQAGVAVNAVPFASAPASLQALFPGYDVFLTTTGSPSSPMFLGLDTTSISAAVPSVLVTDVAAVPEPASAAGVLLGAAGLLLGRRKRKA